jgi:hypothetical protein
VVPGRPLVWCQMTWPNGLHRRCSCSWACPFMLPRPFFLRPFMAQDKRRPPEFRLQNPVLGDQPSNGSHQFLLGCSSSLLLFAVTSSLKISQERKKERKKGKKESRESFAGPDGSEVCWCGLGYRGTVCDRVRTRVAPRGHRRTH